MAQVTYNSAGSGATGTTSISTAYPGNLSANDIILYVVLIGDTTNTPTTPTDFALLFGPDTTAVQRGYVYWKRATGSESGSLSVTTNATAQCRARMFSFRGVRSAGTIYEGESATTSGSDDQFFDQGVTTTGTLELAINILFIGDDRDTDSMTGETGGDWTQAVAEYENTTGTPDGTIDLHIATMAAAGTINGGSTVDTGTVTNYAVRGFALLPDTSPTVVLNTPADVVNTYYFDVSDAGPTDPEAVWTNDTNAFDGDTGTSASTSTNGSATANELFGEGTNAPATNGEIVQVQARVYADDAGVAASYGNYTILSTPTGGWTWAKVQALEVAIYKIFTGLNNRIVIDVFTDSRGENLGQTSRNL